MSSIVSSLLLSGLILVQASSTTPQPQPQEIIQPQEVRSLAGKLNKIPVFNSNSPELVLKEGILLSTFSPQNKANPEAHLNFPLQGNFDIFAHHVAKAPTPEDLRSLYLGIILHNPTQQPVTVDILQAASYLSQPDAPFIELPPQVEDPTGKVYAGPGSRVMGDILRGRRHQDIFEPQIVIAPGESQMLVNLPIPVRELEPPLNGRSTYMRLRSNGKVYAASLAMFAPKDETGQERPPTLEEWENLLEEGELATPRDRAPTPPGTSGNIVYGRVAGVSAGSIWKAKLSDLGSVDLAIPGKGEAFSYGLSTLDGGQLGTNQVQSAPMLVRYPDTAYKAHGNYGVQYSIALPLRNPTQESQTVAVKLQTPIKQDQLKDGLRFLDPPAQQVFFRGTVRVSYEDEQKVSQTRYFHLVQKRGQRGEPLVKIKIPTMDWRLVQVDFLYPPDATPPQVLTVETLK
ncbi:DUF3370 domain-containing protein [Candidatus Gracilibacteria bacterium]|nr:DUF3370 domain-containing protein [Candidatus Gracilibacteria bacterium]NJP20005.1 DUF3370 domain-containing protein [Hydrococcus sp. CRU_1_1]